MPYAKLNSSGCSVRNGVVQLRIDCYLEKKDTNYDLHHVFEPIIPPGGYPGEVNSEGSPADQAAYDTWLASLPTEERDNPFCCHFIQIEPEMTDAEILVRAKEVLAMVYANWELGDLRKNRNPIVKWDSNPKKAIICTARLDEILAGQWDNVEIRL